jgi:hypothetical protein
MSMRFGVFLFFCFSVSFAEGAHIDFSIVMNGNGTCSNSLFGASYEEITQHATYVKLIGEAKPSQWIYTCHLPGLGYGPIQFLRSDKGKKIFSGTMADVLKAVMEMTADPDRIFDLKAYGYSYGGPEAMRVVHGILASRLSNVIPYYLGRNDPISSKCELKELGKPACTSFPMDVSNDEQQTLNENIGFWHHWYQRESTQIHSEVSPNDFPHRETFKQYKVKAPDNVSSHVEMMHEPEILEEFVQALP